MVDGYPAATELDGWNMSMHLDWIRDHTESHEKHNIGEDLQGK